MSKLFDLLLLNDLICVVDRIPNWLLRRMLLNNVISAGMGFVPIVGDIALATYKANSRNAALLEEFLRIRGEEALKVFICARRVFA